MAVAYAWSTSAAADTTSVTSLSIDITAATVDEWVYCFVTKAKSGSTSLAGWDLVLQGDQGTNYHYAIWRRLKQSGDTTFNVTWTTSTHALACLVQWTGLDGATPDEEAVAQFHTTGDTWSTATATPNGASRWAATFTSYRTTNVADNSPSWTTSGLTQRLDVDTSAGTSPWVVALSCDTNATVTEASHDYAHVADITNGTGVSVLLYLVPAGVNGSVTGELATASAQAEAPTVAGNADVVAVTGTATAVAQEPSVSGTSGGSATVAAQVMQADAAAVAPTVTVDYTASPAVITVSAQAEVPQVALTVLIFTPPTVREHYGDKRLNPLGVRIGYPTGQTVLKRAGFYTTHLVHDVSDEDITAAEEVYLGGHDYVISNAEAADLTAAGYGAYITSRAQ